MPHTNAYYATKKTLWAGSGFKLHPRKLQGGKFWLLLEMLTLIHSFTTLDRKAAKKNNQISGPTLNQELEPKLKLLPDVSLKMRIEIEQPVCAFCPICKLQRFKANLTCSLRLI